MPDEQPKPDHDWKRGHPVLGLVVGTLDDIGEQRVMIEQLLAGFKGLEQRVIKIENQLGSKQTRKKKKAVKPDVVEPEE